MRKSHTMSRRKSCVSRQAILIRVRSSAGKVREGIYAGLKPMGSPSERGKTGADQVAAEVSDLSIPRLCRPSDLGTHIPLRRFEWRFDLRCRQQCSKAGTAEGQQGKIVPAGIGYFPAESHERRPHDVHSSVVAGFGRAGGITEGDLCVVVLGQGEAVDAWAPVDRGEPVAGEPVGREGGFQICPSVTEPESVGGRSM